VSEAASDAGAVPPPRNAALYRERRHPLWFVIRSWAWLAVIAAAIPVVVVVDAPALQVVAGVVAVAAELIVLARILDWVTTYVVITPSLLRVVGYDGEISRIDLKVNRPRVVQSRTGRRFGYAHVAVRLFGIKIRSSNQLFLSRPDALRAAIRQLAQGQSPPSS
jgi:hypothetical protein